MIPELPTSYSVYYVRIASHSTSSFCFAPSGRIGYSRCNAMEEDHLIRTHIRNEDTTPCLNLRLPLFVGSLPTMSFPSHHENADGEETTMPRRSAATEFGSQMLKPRVQYLRPQSIISRDLATTAPKMPLCCSMMGENGSFHGPLETPLPANRRPVQLVHARRPQKGSPPFPNVRVMGTDTREEDPARKTAADSNSLVMGIPVALHLPDVPDLDFTPQDRNFFMALVPDKNGALQPRARQVLQMRPTPPSHPQCCC